MAKKELVYLLFLSGVASCTTAMQSTPVSAEPDTLVARDELTIGMPMARHILYIQNEEAVYQQVSRMDRAPSDSSRAMMLASIPGLRDSVQSFGFLSISQYILWEHRFFSTWVAHVMKEQMQEIGIKPRLTVDPQSIAFFEQHEKELIVLGLKRPKVTLGIKASSE